MFNTPYRLPQKSLLGCICLVLCLVGGTFAQEQFVDDFDREDGPVDGWTIFSGDWTIKDNQLYVANGGGEKFVWLGDPPVLLPPEFEISFTLEFVELQNVWNFFHGGIIFFAERPTHRFDAACYTADWNGNPADTGVRTYRWTSGGGFAGMTNLLPRSDPPREWRIFVQEDLIRVFGDGELLIEDYDITYREGYFGFWNWTQSAMTVDNFVFSELTCELEIDDLGLLITNEEECDDGEDNDCDGDIDNADVDCCEPNQEFEESCDDGADNDCDGKTDGEDFEDCCVPEDEICDDGVDNDCDTLLDEADDDCCLASELICDDGMDDDCDGLVDGDDLDCCPLLEPVEESCDDGIDNDCDEVVDCDDSDCRGSEACPLEVCGDGIDNDADGDTDCADGECAFLPPCEEVLFEDEFDRDDGFPDGWTVWDGEWEIFEEELFVLQGGEHTIWLGEPPVEVSEQFALSFTLNWPDWTGEGKRHGGLVFFADTPNNRFGTRGYTADWLDGSGIRSFRWDPAGSFNGIFPDVAMGEPPVEWKVTVQGDTIRVYGDGELLQEIVDDIIRGGYIGFWNHGQTNMSVDNVVLSVSCSPTEPTETTCDDGVDNDCDGAADDADADCQCMPSEESETTCDDGVDNDCDENVDDADADCQPSGVGPFIRGDCDGNGTVGGSPTEAIVLLNFAFRGGSAPDCLAACDAEANGSIGITDALRILRHSFLGVGEPDAPFPDCVTSDLGTDEDLGCETPRQCN